MHIEPEDILQKHVRDRGEGGGGAVERHEEDVHVEGCRISVAVQDRRRGGVVPGERQRERGGGEGRLSAPPTTACAPQDGDPSDRCIREVVGLQQWANDVAEHRAGEQDHGGSGEGQRERSALPCGERKRGLGVCFGHGLRLLRWSGAHQARALRRGRWGAATRRAFSRPGQAPCCGAMSRNLTPRRRESV